MDRIKNFIALQISKPRWLRRFIKHRPTIAYVQSNGLKFFLYPGDLYGPSYHLMHWGVETYEPQNQKIIRKILANGNVFIDVGANIGIYSIIAASQGPDVKVYAFEPEDNAKNCIEASASANALKNIKVFSVAVSDHEGDGVFFLDLHNHGGNSLIKESIDHGGDIAKVKVRLTTLDTFVRQEAISRLDLVKVDVQEHEHSVLMGGRQAIEKFRPVVLIESNLKDLNQLLDFFADFNYSILDPKTEKIYSLSEAQTRLINEHPVQDHLHADFFFFPNEKEAYFRA